MLLLELKVSQLKAIDKLIVNLRLFSCVNAFIVKKIKHNAIPII